MGPKAPLELPSDMLRIDPADTPPAVATFCDCARASVSRSAVGQGCDCCNCGDVCKPPTKNVRLSPELCFAMLCWDATSCVSVSFNLANGAVSVNNHERTDRG